MRKGDRNVLGVHIVCQISTKLFELTPDSCGPKRQHCRPISYCALLCCNFILGKKCWGIIATLSNWQRQAWKWNRQQTHNPNEDENCLFSYLLQTSWATIRPGDDTAIFPALDKFVYYFLLRLSSFQMEKLHHGVNDG